MEYKNENGDTVYGFTQSKKNADEIIKHQKRNNTLLNKNNTLFIMLIAILFLFFMTIAYVVYRIEAGNILANVVARCVC